jgi:hypothetical protein
MDDRNQQPDLLYCVCRTVVGAIIDLGLLGHQSTTELERTPGSDMDLSFNSSNSLANGTSMYPEPILCNMEWMFFMKLW